MNAVELRSEIIALLNKTDDVGLLEWLKSVISDPFLSKEMVDDMIKAAEMSEDDIASGRTYSIEETRRWLEDRKREA